MGRRQAQRRTVTALDVLGDEVMGYRIQAADGYIGRVADGHVFVPLNAIERIDKGERKIYVTPTREEVRRGSRRSLR